MSEPVIETLKNATDQHYRKQLYALLQVTKAINSNFSSSDLFTIYQYILEKQLGFTRFAYCNTFDGIWRWPVCVDSEFEIGKIKPEEDLVGFTEMTFLYKAENPRLDYFNIVIPVQHKNKALAYLLIGAQELEEIREARMHDLEFVQTISNVITVAIENKRLFKDNVEQEMLKRELEMAREVQSMLIPSSLPLDEHYDFSAFYQPKRQIGGDYYDFIRINNDEVIFCVADVSGKGIAAALLMANFQAYLRANVKQTDDLEKIIRVLNDHVARSAKGEKFITLFIARYNHSTRKLKYINAGHNPPLLCSTRGIEELSCGTTGLGMLEKLYRLESGELDILPGSVLVCYTDGLVEQENEGGVDFGMEQLENFIKDNMSLTSTQFNQKLVNHLGSFKGNVAFVDDIALLTGRFF